MYTKNIKYSFLVFLLVLFLNISTVNVCALAPAPVKPEPTKASTPTKVPTKAPTQAPNAPVAVAPSQNNVPVAQDTVAPVESTTEGNTSTENTTVASNDGNIKKDPFMDSGAPTRYSNGKYYDIAVPYNTKIMDIGGMATGGTVDQGSAYKIDPFVDNLLTQNCCFLRENSSFREAEVFSHINSTNKQYANDQNTGLNYYVVDGVKYYLAGIGQGCYAYSGWAAYCDENGSWQASDLLYNGTPSYSGLLFDLILKDGTQLHFVVGDFIGYAHSVGCSGKQDGISYERTDMKYTQYKAMWHCKNTAHMVEYFGDKGTTDTRTALGISDSNPVLYMRIWDMSLSKGGVQCKSGMEELTNSGEALSTASSGDGSSTDINGTTDENGQVINPQFMKGAYSESQLSSFSTLCETSLEAASSSSLTVDEVYTLNNWKNNLDSSLKDTVLVTWMRRIVMWLGILFSIWMIFLYLAYWFDRVNIFFEFSLLELVSLGRLRVSPEEDNCTWQFSELIKNKSTAPMTVNNRAMIEIMIIGFIFSGLVISGVLFKIVGGIVIWILKLLKVIV